MKRSKLLLAIAGLGLSVSAHAAITISGSVFPSSISTTGAGDNVNVGGDFTTPGTGTLTIDNGSTLTTASPVPFSNIAPLSGSTGTVIVSGSDGSGNPSTWRLEGIDTYTGNPADLGDGAFLTVGRSGTGTLKVEGGAKVQIDSLGATMLSPLHGAGFQVGRNAGGEGTLNLNGSGTELSVTGDFAYAKVGRFGQGTMNITDGATLLFNGKNTVLHVAHVANGSSNKGMLNVNSGGTVVGPLYMVVGGSPGADGTVNLDGASSSITLEGACEDPCPSNFSILNVGAHLTVGANEGRGSVNITGGAKFLIDSSGTAGAIYPGFSLGANEITGPKGTGIMTVQGTGSELLVKGDQGFFSVGRLENGTGTLIISDGGQVIMQNGDGKATGYLGDRPGATGTIVVDGTNSLLDAGSYLGVGVNENQQDAGNGFLILNNNGTVQADQIAVGGGGYVEGNGTLQGNVLVNRGTVSPSVSVVPPKSEKINAGVGGQSQGGSSLSSAMVLKSSTLPSSDPPGTININGDFTMNAGVLVIEIAGTAPGQYDVLNVAGNIDIEGGTIKFVFIGGYLPQQGQSIQFLQGSGGSTVTIGPNVTKIYQGAAPGFKFDVLSGGTGTGLQFIALNDAQPLTSQAIPTLSRMAIVLLALLLAGIAFDQLRRRWNG